MKEKSRKGRPIRTTEEKLASLNKKSVTDRKSYKVRIDEVITHTVNDSFQIRLPRVCSLVDLPEHMTRFSSSLEKAFFRDRVARVNVDHTGVSKLSPEVAMVLIADFDRYTIYSPKSNIVSKDPSLVLPDSISEILNDIGYLEHFGVSAPGSLLPERKILKIMTGRQAESEDAAKLVDHFLESGKFPIEFKKPLHVALIECMNNVRQHAYRGSIPRTFKSQWWMFGYRNLDKDSICFAFYDQGKGIESSIRENWKLRALLVGKTGPEILEFAVTEGLSRTGDPGRGTGLPSLKTFLDSSSRGGNFTIVSQKNFCKFEKSTVRKQRLKHPLNGTLIVWNILLK